ncbi:MAG: putative 2-aminoethylphosphonate ABC transporter ATP-binding protein [Microcoleaceae cyanobacterium]
MTYSEQSKAEASQLHSSQSPASYQNLERLAQERDEAIGSNRGEAYLRIEGVNKYFGDFAALRDIYLEVYPGEFVCLLGPSGCGKTTLLRIIAGLESQSKGRVIQAGKDVSNAPPSQRDFGIVFQSYALFPNLTVEQNIGYGLQNEGRPKQEIRAKVNELISLVGLEGNARKYPSQMSGGQQQRVALARALAQSPSLLLLDEPLSALDAKVREKLRIEISQLQKRLGITTVMVTHDQSEALSMADRVVVMSKGCIAQVGTPHSIYQEPQSPFVADFVGEMNFVPGRVLSTTQVSCGNIVINTTPQSMYPEGHPVELAIRPEDIRLIGELDSVDQETLNSPNILAADVESFEFLGSSYLVNLRPEGNGKSVITIGIPIHEARQVNLRPNECCLAIYVPPELIRIFPES